jgi:glucose/arabinose dehydrogenase
MDMKNRMVMMTAVAGVYLITCAAGFAQNATQNHGNDSEANSAAVVEAHNMGTASPAAATATRKSPGKTLPLAPVAKGDANTPQSLRAAQENPYLLLTYKEKDETKMLANPYKESPTKVFGPGWNTNIDALRNNPYAPAPAPAYVDLKTLGHAVAKVL